MKPPKRPPKRPYTPSPVTSPKIPLPDALREIIRRSRAIEELSLRITAIQQDCHLELAICLMKTKDELILSWESMAEEFSGICNQNTLHRLVNRNTHLKGKKYKEICLQLNSLRARNSMPVLPLPCWEEVE